MRILFLIGLIIFCQNIFAEELPIVLEKAPVNLNDTASIERGAKFVASHCVICHALVYLRYNKIARDAGITYEKIPQNTKWPFDVKPPDLSLVVSYRGADWVYTYLHSFYQDPKSPTGFNNLLVVNSKMVGILMPYQGQQVKVTDANLFADKKFAHQLQWYDVLELKQQGSMTPAQFDATITDVVNFLAYASTPYRSFQERLGIFVLGFLLILWILFLLLKKEYWKDVK